MMFRRPSTTSARHAPVLRAPSSLRARWLVLASLLIASCGNDPAQSPGGSNDPNGNDPSTGGSETVLRIVIEDQATYMQQFQAAQDRLIVQVVPGSLIDASALASSVAANLHSFDANTGMAVLNVRADRLADTAAKLDGMPEVAHLEREYYLPVAAIPSDPLYASQWHLGHVAVHDAWDITLGDPNLIIAVVDTGVDVNHPDLQARIVGGYNFVTSTTDASDCCGHGTLVAGTLGAITNNGTGVAGAAWQCRIMPIRVAKFDGTSETAKLSDIAKGIIYAVDQGAKVVNVSFTGVLASSSILAAAQYAFVNGAIVVAAAGNTAKRDTAANSPYIVTVSASDPTDSPAWFTTYGPGIDLAAPGVGIVSTARSNAYESANGTSFASPLTAGVVALMCSAAPAATPKHIVDLLLASADDRGSPGVDEYFGHGRLNAARAVEAARDNAIPPDTTPPSVVIRSPVGGATLTGSTRLTADATDASPIAHISVALDGAPIATDPSAPYVFLVDPLAGPAGAHTIAVTARDIAGNQSAPASITVLFEHGQDSTPPNISVVSPASGVFLSGKTTLVFRVDDAEGLSRVSIQLDGQAAGGADASGNGARVEVDIDPAAQNLSPGAHTLGVSVRNVAGLVATTVYNFIVP